MTCRRLRWRSSGLRSQQQKRTYNSHDNANGMWDTQGAKVEIISPEERGERTHSRIVYEIQTEYAPGSPWSFLLYGEG